MSTYAIDATAQALRATGVVEPLFRWVDDATTGRRTQTDTQDTDDNGVPLWAVEVMYQAESWGRVSSVVAKVTTPSPTAPTVAAFEVVPFVGLTVTASVVKASGSLRETWRAQGIAGAAGKRGE